MERTLQPLKLFSTLVLFGIPTVLFFGIAYGIIPYLTSSLNLHPAMSWFIGGSMIFIPLLITALVMVYRDGYTTPHEIINRFRLKKLTRRDWTIIIVAMIAIGFSTGIIVGLAAILHQTIGIPMMEFSPPFMKFEPFTESERWMLGVWAIMFFFNITGEELLWRGYILPRQMAAHQHYGWMVNAACWMMFHISFGPSLMIMLVPIIFILPYAVNKSGNTTIGIVIHTLLNGPSFILISLGILPS